MSQWGAEGMAEAGSTAEQIVKHYYTGISIGRVSEFLPKDRKG
jgi:stage II sporulation protein D